jgi:thiol-disulfide isomerase/thioredoxin
MRRGVTLALLALLAACGDDVVPRKRSSAPRPQPSAAASQPPSAAKLPDGLVTIEAPALLARAHAPGVRGLLVSVWASWCGSCREELPILFQIRDAFKTAGLTWAFVSADGPLGYDAALKLMHDIGGPSPTVVVAPGTMGTFKRAMSPSWRGGIPAMFLFDSTGKLRHLWEGPILEQEITPVLQGFLSGEAVDGETRTSGPAQ